MAISLVSTGLSGDIRNTGQPCFEITGSHATAPDSTGWATNNGWAVTERFDQGADFNTASGYFTAPVTGRYLFTWMMRLDGLPDEVYVHLGLGTGNTTRTSITILSDASMPRTYHFLAGSCITDMDASDGARIDYYLSGSGTAGINSQSTFSGCLLC